MAKKILIVDDAIFMRTILKDILEKAGYEVVGESETGEDAIIKCENLKPDLVTMDMIMTGDGGTKAISKILARNPGVKVLMVSAMGQQALILEAVRAGAKGFIVKPFKPQDVINEVKRIIG